MLHHTRLIFVVYLLIAGLSIHVYAKPFLHKQTICEESKVFNATGNASNQKQARSNSIAKLDNQLKSLSPPIKRKSDAKISCKKSWWWRCEASYKVCL